MQDKYVKTFGKVQMDKDKKAQMRSILEEELMNNKDIKPAKKTALSSGAKAGLAVAAAVTVTMGVLCLVPNTRQALYAGAMRLFGVEIPADATDYVDEIEQNRKNRVIPTDAMSKDEAEAVMSEVTKRDKIEDKYNKDVKVNADYYSDKELNEMANYFSGQSCTIFDLKKDADFDDGDTLDPLWQEKDGWYKEGFTVRYRVGDNAYGHNEDITVFKADPDQLKIYMTNTLNRINYERKDHGQKTVSFDDFWKESKDKDGNTVYEGQWTGPDPSIKILDSDSARFDNIKVVYDQDTGLAVATVSEGGGVG